MAERRLERVANSALQEIARGVEDEASKLEDETWDVSVRAEGRSLIYTYHAKSPITDLGAFHRNTASNEKEIRDDYCSDENSLRVQLKATVTQTYYDANGDWLTSFSFKSGRLLIRRMRRFPPPWTVEAIDGFKIVDSHNQSLAYVLRPFG